LVKDDKVVVSESNGLNEYGKEVNVDENTLFIIASNSKLFTGSSIAKLGYEKKHPG
jgi:CubicO group peptidase (beta-lactamase class C family)